MDSPRKPSRTLRVPIAPFRTHQAPGRTLAVLGLVGLLALTACSTAAEPDSDPAPSAISPDTLVTCEDNGDCAEPGSVRWSLPLEDEYRIFYVLDMESWLVPSSHWLDGLYPEPGAVAGDGILYHHRDDLVTAIDTANGTELWTEDLDQPVAGAVTVGDTLVVGTLEPGEGNDIERIHLLVPEDDGVRRVEADLPEDLQYAALLPGNDTHLAVREANDRGYGQTRFFLMDGVTGEVEWTHTERMERLGHYLTDDNTLYLRRSADSDTGDPARVVGVADGRVVSEFDPPQDVESSQPLWVTDTGELLFDGGHCEDWDSKCEVLPTTAVDARSGAPLWTLDEPGSVVSLTTDDSGPRLHLELLEGYRTVDARTGEVLAEGEEAAGETEALLDAFGAQREDPRDALPYELHPKGSRVEVSDATVARREEASDMIPAELVGPGVDGLVLDGLAAAPRHLTSYVAEGGEVVAVLLGCAPGGVRPPTRESDSPRAVCAEPRLFAVDYGV